MNQQESQDHKNDVFLGGIPIDCSSGIHFVF